MYRRIPQYKNVIILLFELFLKIVNESFQHQFLRVCLKGTRNIISRDLPIIEWHVQHTCTNAGIFRSSIWYTRYHWDSSMALFNPIPAGVLENQDTLGGGVNLTPPSKTHVLCPNMTNDTSLESSCALLLESAKKFANLRKLNFLSQNQALQ